MTAQFTQGKGDVQSPDVSFDGKKLVFSMRCPSSNTSKIADGSPACTGQWNIWEYDMTTGGLLGGTFRRLTNGGGDDVEPSYLPAGQRLRVHLEPPDHVAHQPGRSATPTSRSTSTSASRSSTCTRWTPTAATSRRSRSTRATTATRRCARTATSCSRAGTTSAAATTSRSSPSSRTAPNMFVLYGAHSDGNSFLHPRDMDPKGTHAGFITSDLMPLSRTHEGGGLMFIDAAHYSEQNTPATSGRADDRRPGPGDDAAAQHRRRPLAIRPHHDAVPALGRHRPRARFVHAVRGDAQGRRRRAVLDPHRRRDRAPVGHRRPPDRPTSPRTTCRTTSPPSYAIYMFDPKAQTFLIVAAPPAGHDEHAPGRDPGAHRAERHRADRRSTRRSRRRTSA